MSAPNLLIQVEPWDGSALLYAPLAAKTSQDPTNGQLLLILTITNNEPLPIRLMNVTVSFIGPPIVGPSVNEVTTDPGGSPVVKGLTIPAGQTGQWTLLEYWNDNILLPIPAPGAVTLSLFCETFSVPAEVSMPLAQYAGPAMGGYAFPAKTADLVRGEYWTGFSSGDYHRARAYDLKVYAYNGPSDGWQAFAAGADLAKNESFLAWDKPIYAIADGVVKHFCDTMPNNTPGQLPSSPAFNEGNHLYIQHGVDLVLYAHFKTGTLHPAVQSVGASVVEGQLLGRVGNSGRSFDPHLHISVLRTATLPPPEGPLRPLPFGNVYVLDINAVSTSVWPPDNDAPWNAVSAQCLPSVLSAIWPGDLRLGRKSPVDRMSTVIYMLAWFWLVIVGGLMLTPRGPYCVVCGPALSRGAGAVSVVLGALGL
ncbi:MAG: M23 family metallopeptidase, partial [bacterium]